MDRFFHRRLQIFILGFFLLLNMLLLGGCADKETQVQEEVSEAETTLPSTTEETQQTDGTDSAAVDESALTEVGILPAESSPEPMPEPTPMPMFDIIDGRTIYLSITEEEFIEIAEFLRAGLSVNDAALAGILANLQGESGFNPHKIGDGGEAYGICQWRNTAKRTTSTL